MKKSSHHWYYRPGWLLSGRITPFKGYEVHGLIRRASTFNTGRIDHLYVDLITPRQRFSPLWGPRNAEQLAHLIYNMKPDEDLPSGRPKPCPGQLRDARIYRRDHGPGDDAHSASHRRSGIKTRFYQASSSEMFGKRLHRKNEHTPFQPRALMPRPNSMPTGWR